MEHSVFSSVPIVPDEPSARCLDMCDEFEFTAGGACRRFVILHIDSPNTVQDFPRRGEQNVVFATLDIHFQEVDSIGGQILNQAGKSKSPDYDAASTSVSGSESIRWLASAALVMAAVPSLESSAWLRQVTRSSSRLARIVSRRRSYVAGNGSMQTTRAQDCGV